MSWNKEGRIYNPEEHRSEWKSSHAAVPIAEHLDGDRYRIYFSSRDGTNRSHIGYFEIDFNNPESLLKISKDPVLKPSKLGTFDDAGAMTSWITNHEGEKRLYFIGWNLGTEVPFRNSLGLAISRDGGNSFERFSDGPIMDRSIHDPTMVASACVLLDENTWRMWYLSGLSWDFIDQRYKPKYHIKYSESKDGINWERSGIVCIDFKDEKEHAISRPCVVKESGIYRMWYSYRGQTYRIGYAESSDGVRWTRKDNEAGIDVSSEGWDSEMIEYPYVFVHGDTKIMLYNGNGYGKSGIGYAVLNE